MLKTDGRSRRRCSTSAACSVVNGWLLVRWRAGRHEPRRAVPAVDSRFPDAAIRLCSCGGKSLLVRSFASDKQSPLIYLNHFNIHAFKFMIQTMLGYRTFRLKAPKIFRVTDRCAHWCPWPPAVRNLGHVHDVGLSPRRHNSTGAYGFNVANCQRHFT